MLEARFWSGIGMLESVIAGFRGFRIFILFLPPVVSVDGGQGYPARHLGELLGPMGW